MVSKQIKLTAVTAALIAASSVAFPANAQYSVMKEQPAVGDLHVKEAQLEAEMASAYQLGLIDPMELANMRRDLDAIRVKEESYRMGSSGLTSGGSARIADRLGMFEGNLQRHCSDKGGRVVAMPVIEYR
jgi:hypothetical protein